MRGVLCRVSDVFRQLSFASQLSIFSQVRPEPRLSTVCVASSRARLSHVHMSCLHPLWPRTVQRSLQHSHDSHSSLGNQVLGDRQKDPFHPPAARQGDGQTRESGNEDYGGGEGRKGMGDLNGCCIPAGRNGKTYFLSGVFLPVVKTVGGKWLRCRFSVAFTITAGESVCRGQGIIKESFQELL